MSASDNNVRESLRNLLGYLHTSYESGRCYPSGPDGLREQASLMEAHDQAIRWARDVIGSDPFDCEEFHNLCTDYRGAVIGEHAQRAYEALQAYCRAHSYR